MSENINPIIERADNNRKCFEKLDEIKRIYLEDDSKAIYPLVASYLFDMPYEDCCAYKNGKRNEEGAVRQNIAKQLCLGGLGLNALSSIYQIDIWKLIVDAFPYTPYEQIEDIFGNDHIEDKADNAYKFISNIAGYCYMLKQKQISGEW